MARLSESTTDETEQFRSFDGSHADPNAKEKPTRGASTKSTMTKPTPIDENPTTRNEDIAYNLSHTAAGEPICPEHPPQGDRAASPAPSSSSSSSHGGGDGGASSSSSSSRMTYHPGYHGEGKPSSGKWKIRKMRDRGAKGWDHEGHSFADTMADLGKGVGLIIVSGLWIPVCLPYDFARGCEYVPVLYGDKLAREPVHITGAKSGVVASGQRCYLGIYDGITGIFVQPYVGARDEGALGFLKGFGKGIGGAVFKPVGGTVGLVAYPMMGFWREMGKGARNRNNKKCKCQKRNKHRD